MRYLKTIPILLVMLLAVLLPEKAQASHLMAANFEYECISACTVEVKTTFYRDCAGVSSIPATPLTFTQTSGSCTGSPTPVTAWSAVSIVEVTPICPSVPTRCTTPGAVVNGVEEYSYTRQYDICGIGSCEFTLSYNSCCRNGAITSLTSAASQGIYIEGATINTALASCNNSPKYTSIPFFYGCVGQAVNVHQGAYDPDGDSLSYSLISCYANSSTTPVSYAPGYSPTQPLGTSWNVSLDSQTGILSLSPTPGNIVVGVICIQINEYRNGVQIGSYVRDMQVHIINCASNNPPVFSAITNLTGGATSSGSTIYACGPFCFDLPTSDPDVGDTLALYWDGNIAGATFASATSPTTLDSMRGINPTGRFCFTPPGPGTYQFLATVEDNRCPVAGFNDQLFTIVVGSGPGTSASASVTGCLDAGFSANACGGTGTYTYQWSGTGGINTNPGNTSANFTHSYAGPGTYSWQVIISDGGSINDTINGSVTITGSLLWTSLITPAGPITLCPGQSQVLDAGAGYSAYSWSNGSATQTINVSASGTYSVTVTDPSGCQFADSVLVTVNSTPAWAFLISSTSNIGFCSGATGGAIGPAGYSSYLWSDGSTNPNISGITTPGAYYLTVTNSLGCLFTDSTVISVDSTPDVSGTVLTSTGAPLVGQKIIVVKYSPLPGVLSAVDSTLTDAAGYYEFCEVNHPDFFIKALPDSATYPGEMPTYYDSTLFWNNAVTMSSAFTPYSSVNFSTLPGTNPGGPGFIGGLVSLGANKTNGVGDPVIGLQVFIFDANTGAIVGGTRTDALGYFSFSNLPLGNYDIAVDHPNVDEVNVPMVPLTATLNYRDNLDFRLHSTYFEWVQATAATPEVSEAIATRIYPNPIERSLHIDLPEWNGTMQATIQDLQGRTLGSWELQNTQTVLDLSQFDNGVYMLRLVNEGKVQIHKLVIQK